MEKKETADPKTNSSVFYDEEKETFSVVRR